MQSGEDGDGGDLDDTGGAEDESERPLGISCGVRRKPSEVFVPGCIGENFRFRKGKEQEREKVEVG